MGSKRENVMLAYPVDEKRLKTMPDTIFFQRKLNGERVRVEWYDRKPILYSSCGNEMPFFSRVKEYLLDYPLLGVNFDGEMYCHGMSREDIHSICSRRKNIHPDENLLSFHVFDTTGDEFSQRRRLEVVAEIPEGNNIVQKVETIFNHKKYLLDYADQFIREGYEGVIVRNPFAYYTPRKCNYLLKFKPTSQDDYLIVGFQEEEDIYGVPKGRLGSVIVKDSDGHIFSVGTGKAFDAAGRSHWWKRQDRLIGMTARVKHSDIMTINDYPTCTSLLSIEITKETPNGLHETP